MVEPAHDRVSRTIPDAKPQQRVSAPQNCKAPLLPESAPPHKGLGTVSAVNQGL